MLLFSGRERAVGAGGSALLGVLRLWGLGRDLVLELLFRVLGNLFQLTRALAGLGSLFFGHHVLRVAAHLEGLLDLGVHLVAQFPGVVCGGGGARGLVVRGALVPVEIHHFGVDVCAFVDRASKLDGVVFGKGRPNRRFLAGRPRLVDDRVCERSEGEGGSERSERRVRMGRGEGRSPMNAGGVWRDTNEWSEWSQSKLGLRLGGWGPEPKSVGKGFGDGSTARGAGRDVCVEGSEFLTVDVTPHARGKVIDGLRVPVTKVLVAVNPRVVLVYTRIHARWVWVSFLGTLPQRKLAEHRVDAL